jgi:serine/threonine-protein kinase HipA
MIALTLLRYAGGLADVKEMARRLALNALLGNGDAHIKNWSLIYDNPRRPRLAPAYDLVSTVAYAADASTALNMAGVKRFDKINLDTFAALFTRVGLRDQARDELMEEVRTTVRRVLSAWPACFTAAEVPARLTARIEAHVSTSALSRA